jgi:hypothetical protein
MCFTACLCISLGRVHCTTRLLHAKTGPLTSCRVALSIARHWTCGKAEYPLVGNCDILLADGADAANLRLVYLHRVAVGRWRW